MPNDRIRKQIFTIHAGEHHCLTDDDFLELGKQTEGYSGSDISTLVNEALMRPLRELQNSSFFKKVPRSAVEEEDEERLTNSWGTFKEESKDELVWVPCDDTDKGAKKIDLASISGGQLWVRKANYIDFRDSIRNSKPTVHPQFVDLYRKFLEKYGHKD